MRLSSSRSQWVAAGCVIVLAGVSLFLFRRDVPSQPGSGGPNSPVEAETLRSEHLDRVRVVVLRRILATEELAEALCKELLTLPQAIARLRAFLAGEPADSPLRKRLGPESSDEELGRHLFVYVERLAVDRARHYLGDAYRDQGRLGEAAEAYRRAIELKPDCAEAHCNLGIILRRQGMFDQARAALKRGHELGSQRPGWPYPSARWLEESQRLEELEVRLPAILRGEAQPATAAERNAYALLCHDKMLYVASASLRSGALAADPKLADDLEGDYRYDAACAAALAGCGQGTDAGQLNDKRRACWRKQALRWLRADLEADGKRLESGRPGDRLLVSQRLRGWHGQQDLAGLRDPAGVAKLPSDEQSECKQLWDEVQALLSRAEAAK